MASAGARASVAVHSVGKFKTAAQLTAIALLLYHDTLFGWFPTQQVGTWLIWVAAVLTLWSMMYYVRQAWPHIRDAA
jgi:phosphatidylglycerophosphate synthase